MKVYVIKNEQGQYQTPDMSFISSIWQADLFNDYEVAKCYCERDCEIIECELMQATELSDYTKPVRKEVLEQVYKVFTNEYVWKELKDWWLGNGNCKELKKCLDAMIEEKSVENIAKKFGHYKNFYQQLDLIQGEDK